MMRQEITGRWRTVLGVRTIAGWRPKSVRQWLITGWWRTVVGRWLIIGWQRGHTLGFSMMRRRARGEERCRGDNRSAKMAHDILCLMSPAKLNTAVGRLFRPPRFVPAITVHRRTVCGLTARVKSLLLAWLTWRGAADLAAG